MASWFRDLTDTLGFTKKKIPDSALPQIDPLKRGAENLYGTYATDQFKKLQESGATNPEGYYKLPRYTPTQPISRGTPATRPESGQSTIPGRFIQPTQPTQILPPGYYLPSPVAQPGIASQPATPAPVQPVQPSGGLPPGVVPPGFAQNGGGMITKRVLQPSGAYATVTVPAASVPETTSFFNAPAPVQAAPPQAPPTVPTPPPAPPRPVTPDQVIPPQAPTIETPSIEPWVMAVRDALKAAQAVSVPTQTGYDPAMKEAALAAQTSGIAEQKAEALQQAREVLGKSGITESTVGAKTLGKVGGQYDRTINEIRAGLEAQDLAAQREDRYRNQEAALRSVNQIAGLAGEGAGLTGQAYDIARSGRGEEAGLRSEVRQERTYADSVNDKDFERWLIQNQIDTSARGVDREEAWKVYNEQTRQAENAADTTNKASLFNLGQTQTEGERRQKQVMDLLEMIRMFGAGNQLTPESQIASQKYAAETSGQQNALSNTLGTITKLFGIF